MKRTVLAVFAAAALAVGAASPALADDGAEPEQTEVVVEEAIVDEVAPEPELSTPVEEPVENVAETVETQPQAQQAPPPEEPPGPIVIPHPVHSDFVHERVCGDEPNDIITPPSLEGVIWDEPLYGGVSGGTTTWSIDYHAAEGYEFAESTKTSGTAGNWLEDFTPCPVVIETVTAPTFVDECGVANDDVIVPANTDAYSYEVFRVSAGSHLLNDATVWAVLKPGYVWSAEILAEFGGGDPLWDHSYSAEACPAVPPVVDEPADDDTPCPPEEAAPPVVPADPVTPAADPVVTPAGVVSTPVVEAPTSTIVEPVKRETLASTGAGVDMWWLVPLLLGSGLMLLLARRVTQKR